MVVADDHENVVGAVDDAADDDDDDNDDDVLPSMCGIWLRSVF